MSSKREIVILDPAAGRDGILVPDGDDVSAPALLEYLIDRFTAPGGVVLDPFAGEGTTLVVAGRMGREGWGIERDPGRADRARRLLAVPARLLTADARRVLAETGNPPGRRPAATRARSAAPNSSGGAGHAFPAIDLCLSSPPFMERCEATSPLGGLEEPPRGYEAYIADLCGVYAGASRLLRPGGRVIVEAATIRSAAGVTDLAGDIAASIGTCLFFEGEIAVEWTGTGRGRTRCLVFGAAAVSDRPRARSKKTRRPVSRTEEER